MKKKLSGSSVELRVIRPKDWQSWCDLTQRCRDWLKRWQPDDTIAQYFGGEGDFEARCQIIEREFQFGSAYCYGIFVGNDLVGEATLSWIRVPTFSSGILGYWVDQDRQGLGYASESARLLCEFGFRSAGLHRIEASIMPANLASRRVAEKAGFQLEGTARKFLRIDGRWEDHLIYSLIND